MEHPSGQQFALQAGDTRAVITEVGGGIRSLQHGAVDVLDGFDESEMCDGARGQTLLPWPNRVQDGRYAWAGQPQQLALTEPDRSNAIHGLTRWANWELIELTPRTVHLRHRLHAQIGWPFLLRCDLKYVLREGALDVVTTVENVGDGTCPVAAGAHPYLSAGGATVDDAELHLGAATFLPTDERGIPTGSRPVDGSALDFRGGRRLGGQRIDLTFTDLARDADGRARVRLVRPDGWVVSLWAGAGYDFFEIFTGDTLAPDRRRRGLGVEPMTAPPNALQTGDHLRELAPGERVELTWGVGIARE